MLSVLHVKVLPCALANHFGIVTSYLTYYLR